MPGYPNPFKNCQEDIFAVTLPPYLFDKHNSQNKYTYQTARINFFRINFLRSEYTTELPTVN